MMKALEFRLVAYERLRQIAEQFRDSTRHSDVQDPAHAIHLSQACAADACALELLSIPLDSPPPQPAKKD